MSHAWQRQNGWPAGSRKTRNDVAWLVLTLVAPPLEHLAFAVVEVGEIEVEV